MTLVFSSLRSLVLSSLRSLVFSSLRSNVRGLLAAAAVLSPAAGAFAQEGELPRADSYKPDTTLMTAPNVPKSMTDYVDQLRKQLNTAPTAAGDKPAAKKPGKPGEEAKIEKGGPVPSNQALLFDDELEDWQRANRKKPAGKKLDAGVSDVHVVQPGDTLWDLSSKYLNSPWVWPRVWSYNPHITNPHWIYPGQVVRFRPLVAAAAEPEDNYVPGRRPETVRPGHTGVVAFRSIGFATKEQVKAAGKLKYSPNDSILLSRYQTAYVAFEKAQDVKVGDKFLSARIEKEIEHPVTGKSIGFLYQVTGELEVTATAQEKRYFTTTVRRSWRSVERSNIILPWEELQHKTERRPNTKALKGYVVATAEQDEIGKYQLAIVDLGSKLGVEYGNLLRIVRRGDGYLRPEEFKKKLDKMPLEELGEMLVLNARPDFSTVLVLRTLTEARLGDKVEMRKGE